MRLILFFFLLPAMLLAQNGSLKGTVTAGNVPQPFAVVALDNGKPFAISDSAGFFVIKEVAAGKHLVRVSLTGFRLFEETISIREGDVLTKNIVLRSDTAGNLDEVVVTGTMREQSLKDSPIPIEVLTPKLFQKNPTPSLFEAIGMVNGVQPQLNCSVCNTGDIHINGMEGPYTMVTIDGMPIVSSLSTVYGLSGIPNSIVQRIEVVKGPAGTLYGSEAVGGLVNVITKPVFGQPKFSADVFATSYKDVNTDLSGAFSIGKNVHSLLGISHFYFDERWDVNKDNFTDVTLQNRLSVFNKWSFISRKQKTSSVAFRYVYEDRYGGEMQWQPKWRGSDSIYGESIYTRRFEVIGNFRLPVQEDIQLQYSWNHHAQDSYYGTSKFLAFQQVAFAQLLWNKKVNEKHYLLVGTPVRFTWYDDNTVVTASGDSAGIQNKPQEILLPGVFIQDEFECSKKIKMLPGLRVDHHSVHGIIFSPRFALKYKHNENTSWRFSFGNGYRVVNLFTEDHAALTGSRQVVIKEELKPEKSWNGNISFSKMIVLKKSYVNIDAAGFYTYFTNKIVGDLLSDPEKIIYDNLNGYAISRGISCNVEWSCANGLKFLAGATLLDVFQNNKDSAGNFHRQFQLQAPPFSGNFAISYKIPKINVAVDFTGKLNSPMHLPVLPNDYRPEKSPWFCIANLQLSKKMRKGFEFYGGVKNIFNFLPKYPLMRPFDPFDKNAGDASSNPYGYTFDTNYNYASLQGARVFLGFRYILK